jgi:hypothetical protein
MFLLLSIHGAMFCDSEAYDLKREVTSKNNTMEVCKLRNTEYNTILYSSVLLCSLDSGIVLMVMI